MSIPIAILCGSLGFGFVLLIAGAWMESRRIRKLKTPQEWDRAQKEYEMERLVHRFGKHHD